jgi:hypothetical protein
MPWRLMAAWRYSSTILHVNTGWRWVVSFTPLPLYLWGRRHRYPLDRRPGGSRSRRGRYGAEKNLLALSGNRTPAVHSVTCRYTDWPVPVHYTNITSDIAFSYTRCSESWFYCLRSICRYIYRFVVKIFFLILVTTVGMEAETFE